ncbi:MAG: hypothetical protein JW913_13275 [Chitinispirillaceae bacterium]|nr:hypothetical protein [Chitinispirillaceae bacterium]
MNRHQGIEAVNFYREAKLHHAVLSDLWEDGALLKTEAGNVPKVREGAAGEYYLATKHGKTKFRGITKEVAQKGNTLCWEIEFTEISPFKEDPLRRMIDEIVYSDSSRDGVADRRGYG